MIAILESGTIQQGTHRPHQQFPSSSIRCRVSLGTHEFERITNLSDPSELRAKFCQSGVPHWFRVFVKRGLYFILLKIIKKGGELYDFVFLVCYPSACCLEVEYEKVFETGTFSGHWYESSS